MAEDIQIHRSGCGLENIHVTLAERAMINNQGDLNISKSKAAVVLQFSCVSCEDLLIKTK